MTADEIRSLLGARPSVHVHVATQGDGSPEVAWGDTFFSVRDESGTPRKMPFATIVTKDYTGFDEESKLDRGGLFRLNIDLGREKFAELFGFAPREMRQHRDRFDFTAINTLFPHPTYGEQGWGSIVNPVGGASATQVEELLLLAHDRSLKRNT